MLRRLSALRNNCFQQSDDVPIKRLNYGQNHNGLGLSVRRSADVSERPQ
jgi:hypothetical protein